MTIPKVIELNPKKKKVTVHSIDVSIDLDEHNIVIIAMTDDESQSSLLIMIDDPKRVTLVADYGVSGLLDYICDELIPEFSSTLVEAYEDEFDEGIELEIDKETVALEIMIYRGE